MKPTIRDLAVAAVEAQVRVSQIQAGIRASRCLEYEPFNYETGGAPMCTDGRTTEDDWCPGCAVRVPLVRWLQPARVVRRVARARLQRAVLRGDP